MNVEKEFGIVKKTLRVAIYCRVSTREQVEGFSIELQKEKINKYIDYHEDVHETKAIRKYYIDEGYSAKNLKRKGISRMLDDINAGKIDMVIIYKLDRMSRSVLDTYKLLALLIDKHCNLIAVIDRLDIYSANGRMLIGVLAIMAQWERETIQERTKDGTSQMVSEGYFPYGYTPFGCYKIDRRLSIDKQNHEILVYMYDRAVAGVTCSEISEELWEKFEMKKRGDAIRKILDRKYNCGEFLYDNQIYGNIVPKMISKQKYELAQYSLKKRRSAITNGNYYFGNSVRCTCGAICSCKITKRPTKRIYYYYCNDCKKRINQEKILESTLFHIIDQSKRVKLSKQEVIIANKLDRIKKKITSTYDSYLKDQLSAKMYGMTISKLEDQEKLIMAKLKSLKVHTFDNWQDSTDIERQKFITTYLKYIVVDLDLNVVNKIVFK